MPSLMRPKLLVTIPVSVTATRSRRRWETSSSNMAGLLVRYMTVVGRRVTAIAVIPCDFRASWTGCIRAATRGRSRAAAAAARSGTAAIALPRTSSRAASESSMRWAVSSNWALSSARAWALERWIWDRLIAASGRAAATAMPIRAPSRRAWIEVSRTLALRAVAPAAGIAGAG